MKRSVLELRPTQFALGMREVQRKAAKIGRMGAAALREYLRARPVPAVRAAKKCLYIVDHHHHVRACWEARVAEVPIEVKADFSHLPDARFWEAMEKAGWSHLGDQFGRGPHPPRLLPESVRGMADDPYRSLAWAARHAGAFAKSEGAFSDFRWADFLRARIDLEPGDEGFARALAAAIPLARSPRARHLPGFIGNVLD